MVRSERKIRYAVVGLGWFAQTAILPAFQNARDNSQLVALVSGDVEKAKATYQDLLTLWKDADPDLALPKEARSEYATLP